MIHQFNHRFGTFEGLNNERAKKLPESTSDQLKDPNYINKSFYYISKNEVEKSFFSKQQNKWTIGYRNNVRRSDERTTIFSILPMVGVGNSIPVISFNGKINPQLISCFLANGNSLIFDYINRQKISGPNLSMFIVKQLPVLSPNTFTNILLSFIVPRVLELTYTAWDIKAFADDVWRDADDAMKALLSQQWEANKSATGGHKWKPPECAEIENNGIPLPPFKWDEERRAVLRAGLDALYAKLYGLSFDELRYILDPTDVYGSDFPGETFRVLKAKEIKKFGEYRTRRLVLEAWEKNKY
jgi:hypothetical protein